jgi:hypothetical protein
MKKHSSKQSQTYLYVYIYASVHFNYFLKNDEKIITRIETAANL